MALQNDDAFKICYGITFGFYMALSHVLKVHNKTIFRSTDADLFTVSHKHDSDY